MVVAAPSNNHFLLLCLMLMIASLMAQLSKSFTVIMSDSSGTLIDDPPQNGYSINKNNGSRTDPSEQAAVYDIMRATGNEWATEIPDVCRGRWHGIECMPDKDSDDDVVFHVVSLSFGALSDDTAFPTCDPTRSFISYSVTRLPHLKTLFFYRCLGHNNPQPVPAFLGLLGQSLQTLVLRENGHVGPIPVELANLTKLRVLDLHGNKLNGSIPAQLNQITGLRSLDLSGNRLTGSIPELSLPVLAVLDLNQNRLMGFIPESIGTSSMSSLLKLDFSRNRLSGSIPVSINGLRNLVLLDLSYNHLSGPLLPVGGVGGLNNNTTNWGQRRRLVSLQALVLKGNPMGSTMIPDDGFEGMDDLMILVLSNMDLMGPIPSSLAKLPNLRVVHLDGNRLNGSIPKTFKEIKHLSELRLNDNSLTGMVPFGRDMVWQMRRKLKLENNEGLCYDPVDVVVNSRGVGLEETLFHSSIRYCSSGVDEEAEEEEEAGTSPPPSSSKTVQHVVASANNKNSYLLSSNGAGSSVLFIRRRATTNGIDVFLWMLVCIWGCCMLV